MTISDLVERALKKGKGAESVAAARLAVLLALQLPDCEDVSYYFLYLFLTLLRKNCCGLLYLHFPGLPRMIFLAPPTVRCVLISYMIRPQIFQAGKFRRGLIVTVMIRPSCDNSTLLMMGHHQSMGQLGVCLDLT